MRKTNKDEKGKFATGLISTVDLVQSVIFIISIINAVMAPVVEKIKGIDMPQFVDKYFDLFNTTSVAYITNCIIMLFFLIKLVVSIIYKNKRRNEDVIGIINCLHENYIHNMRNHVHRLEEIEEEMLDEDAFQNTKIFERYYNNEYKELERVAQQCVNQVSNILNEFMGMPSEGGNSICTCIKMISIYEKDKPISERSLITLARSENSPRKRKQKVGKDIIGENTDFLDLSEGYRNYYYGINLKDKFKKGEYHNSTPGFLYESTVVVPIRFADLHSEVNVNHSDNKKRTVEIIIKNDIDIVGYLCIDTEKVFRSWEISEEVEDIVKILALYSDSLYIYLNAFRRTFAEKNGGMQ